MVLTSVLFPAPLGPITATSSPSPTSRETSQTAGASPYEMARCRASSNDMDPAQIDLDDPVVSHHLVREAGGDDLALVQHHDTMRQLEDGADQVLDEQDGDAARVDLADESDRARDLVRIEP